MSDTTYVAEASEEDRKERERRVVEEGSLLWKRRKEELRRQKHREQCELRELLANYSPWGKPGGGAPCPATLRKKNVPLEPVENSTCHRRGQGWTSSATVDRTRRREQERNVLSVQDMNGFYDDRGTEGNANAANRNEQVQVYELTGGVELVPLLTNRRHYSQPQTTRYLVTDATRPGYTLEPLQRGLSIGNREYIAELTDQMRRKRDRIVVGIDGYGEERRSEQESCRRHFDTWKRLWGRPGHGAPIDRAQRNNLYDILYRPAIY